MHEAAQALLGRHDFTTFRAAECQAHQPVKTLDRLDVERVGDGDPRRRRRRARFLHRQVRSMVGSLQQVGAGRWSVADLSAALDRASASRCGPLAAAGDGLATSIGVDYSGQLRRGRRRHRAPCSRRSVAPAATTGRRDASR